MDQAGHGSRTSVFAGSGGRHNAPDRGKLSRITLAHGQRMAYMLYGNARVTIFNPDGLIFIGDVAEGDLWFFPTGYPHSIQGLGPDGCEFLLVFDEGMFSEYNTFLISGWFAHTPGYSVTARDILFCGRAGERGSTYGELDGQSKSRRQYPVG
jgi:oxalate decarboxylase/phosphoglucose isomerase-like protein (cupin superfamily)